MKHLTITLLLFCTCAFSRGQHAITYGHPESEIAFGKKLTGLLAAFAAVDLFNGTALIAKNGKVLLLESYGPANYAKRKMNTANSLFQIYSLTKSFTATLVLKLVQDKKLSLDDKLSKIYPGFPSGDSILIRHLLTHTSGLDTYNNDGSMPVGSEEAIVAYLKKTPLLFKPGSHWRYSNNGYYLLGFIIQKITGMSYEKAVETYIFKPLQMTHSGFDYKNLSDKNKTLGYTFLYKDSAQAAAILNENELFSSGGIYSTAEDLYKFHLAMQDYTIINKALTDEAYTPFKNNYGYGWFIDSAFGKKIIHHSGGAPGFKSEMTRIEDENICIVLLANDENADLEYLRKSILSIMFGKPYKIPFKITLPKKRLQELAGAFSFKPGFTIYITEENNRLMVQPSRQRKQEVLPETENRCYVPSIDGYLEYTGNTREAPDSLVLLQDGERFVGKKIFASWGITGTATEKGWEGPDINLAPVKKEKGLWALHRVKLKEGELKFRYNNDWTFSYGDDNGNGMANSAGANIKVERGIYDITLDLRTPGAVRYSIQKITE